MFNIKDNNKDILQEIMDEQRKLDRMILKERDLFNLQNQPDLTVNFDENRKQALLISYVHLRTAVKMMRTVGAKWWKNQPQMTDDVYSGFVQDTNGGKFFDIDTDISNISMKIMAIVQELIELEDAISDGKTIDDIQEEFIDVIHFVVSLGLDLGISTQQKVSELYSAKHRINTQRQQSNY